MPLDTSEINTSEECMTGLFCEITTWTSVLGNSCGFINLNYVYPQAHRHTNTHTCTGVLWNYSQLPWFAFISFLAFKAPAALRLFFICLVNERLTMHTIKDSNNSGIFGGLWVGNGGGGRGLDPVGGN